MEHLALYNLPCDNSVARQEYMTKLEKWVTDLQKHNDTMLRLWSAYACQSSDVFNNAEDGSTARPVRNITPVRNQAGLYMYIIPPMWKRVAAEIIDFLILFVIKMFLTIVILESFDIIDLDNYGINSLHKKLQNPKLAMQMSMEILLLEILHRFIVCCYETYWLVVRSATPGKKYMGLTVIHVDNVTHVHGRREETVLAYPCTFLSVKNAIFRSLLKNVFIGLLLPVCFVLLFFKYNRTGYDLMTNSLVVEYNANPPVQEGH